MLIKKHDCTVHVMNDRVSCNITDIYTYPIEIDTHKSTSEILSNIYSSKENYEMI